MKTYELQKNKEGVHIDQKRLKRDKNTQHSQKVIKRTRQRERDRETER